MPDYSTMTHTEIAAYIVEEADRVLGTLATELAAIGTDEDLSATGKAKKRAAAAELAHLALREGAGAALGQLERREMEVRDRAPGRFTAEATAAELAQLAELRATAQARLDTAHARIDELQGAAR